MCQGCIIKECKIVEDVRKEKKKERGDGRGGGGGGRL